VKNEEGSQSVKEERKILQTINTNKMHGETMKLTNKANWIGHAVHRNCLLEHVIGGQTEGRI